jgi:hypothetical protein
MVSEWYIGCDMRLEFLMAERRKAMRLTGHFLVAKFEICFEPIKILDLIT